MPRNTPVPLPAVQWSYHNIGEILNDSDAVLSNVLVMKTNGSTLSFGPTSLLNLSRLFNDTSEHEEVRIEFTCVLINSAGNDTQTSRITECCKLI